MEKIELIVTHQAEAALAAPWSATFGMAGGTIGRAGQNKLVLPDADAEVARVHAMVRLDSDQAYIANLCERRGIKVGTAELQPGQEVPLSPGAEIFIGPYRLQARRPGDASAAAPSATKQIAPTQPVWPVPSLAPMVQAGPPPRSAEAQEPGRGSEKEVLENPPTMPVSALSDLPNPWADIPFIVGGEPGVPEIAQHGSRANVAPYPSPPEADNPFAALGGVDSFPEPAPMQKQAFDPALKQDNAPPSASTNPFAPSAADATARSHSPSGGEHRPLLIPDDFNPFAVESQATRMQQDAWSGDLPARDLAEVAKVEAGGLLQALPDVGRFAGELDDPSHTGLPQQLDPRMELNPLKLFREPGEITSTAVEDHGTAKAASELEQIFSMPRKVAANAATPTAAGLTDASVTAQKHSPAVSELPSGVVVPGLQPAQGLDLSLFGAPLAGVSDLGIADNATEALPVGLASPEAQALSRSEALQSPLQAAPWQPSPHASQDSGRQDAQGRPAISPAASRVASSAEGPHATPHALAAAFLEGAGISSGRVQVEVTPDFMRSFGEALRVAVQGTIDLLAARSEVKREFRADVTVIASGANNPLKFLPTAEGVMLQLAGQTFPGFMRPVEAMKEAHDDLAVHQMALMSGIRAAYTEAVARLGPDEIERTASASGFLSSISAVHRKAALWDDYRQRYEAVRRHAEDDLTGFSGQTFVTAYEAAAASAKESL